MLTRGTRTATKDISSIALIRTARATTTADGRTPRTERASTTKAGRNGRQRRLQPPGTAEAASPPRAAAAQAKAPPQRRRLTPKSWQIPSPKRRSRSLPERATLWAASSAWWRLPTIHTTSTTAPPKSSRAPQRRPWRLSRTLGRKWWTVQRRPSSRSRRK